jgi:glutamate synthase domain-containing protein 1
MGLSAINVNNSMGSNGCAYANDTANHTNGTDGWTAIQFTEDSVLAALVGKMDDSADLISDAVTFAAGQVLYVPCTSVSLTSGACILYKG